jgi:hypothetical protein
MGKTKIPGLQKLIMKNLKGIGFGIIAGIVMFGPNLIAIAVGGVGGGYIYHNWKLIKRK